MALNKVWPDNQYWHPVVATAFDIAADLTGYEFVVTLRSGHQFRGAPVEPVPRRDTLRLLSGVVIMCSDIAAIDVINLSYVPMETT